MKRYADTEIEKLNSLGYLVQSICQFYGDWEFTFRSPYEWHLYRAQGKTLLEAATNAATRAAELGPAIDAIAAARAAARANRGRVRLESKRVRLKPSRVRL